MPLTKKGEEILANFKKCTYRDYPDWFHGVFGDNACTKFLNWMVGCFYGPRLYDAQVQTAHFRNVRIFLLDTFYRTFGLYRLSN
jgi:hypothetical protein